MADSLRDQLLKSGIVKTVQPSQPSRAREGKRAPSRANSMRETNKPRPSSSRASSASNGEMDLAKAYAIRARTDAQERKQAEQAAAEQARLRRERKAKIRTLLEGNTLNKNDVDHVRHFEYGGKIRRLHVDAEQLRALNAGELGVVQQGGRYSLVTRELAEQVREVDAHLLALLVDPSATAIGDDGVPDDLMW
ncbi:MAG: DUF2058 family protein [Rhodanobacter sp.]